MLRRPLRDNLSLLVAALRPKIQHPVRRLDHLQIVLDHDHRIALADQRVEDREQLAHILEMQPVVGSSNMYKVCPVARLDSSLASFTRWASPPLRVVACWPTSM
jgi:hypothetical protein